MRELEEMTIEEYVKEKIKVFDELGIPLTPLQIVHMESLDSEIAIDNYAHDLIVKGMEQW